MVVAYHDRTKHHVHRYAASFGYMDWATQPDPFRRYSGADFTVGGPFEDRRLTTIPAYKLEEER